MQYSILDILTMLGSLGMFLFGMKLMSEALQKVAGNKMRQILAAMTSNRVTGLLTGLLVTLVIQSSSATTVMIVSFVNAGLLSLVQSVGVIMGANIGTTFTAWLITILGFKVKVSIISLPLIGLGFPMAFSRKGSYKAWGELMIGFALLFLGLDFLKGAVPDIKNNPEILEFLKAYTNKGFLSILIFLAIGTILTVVIQSSSATMALTLVMCNNGWIPYEMAAAMVMGENIGTTITANIAAMVTNNSAMRAARIHLLFNIIGVIWMLILFRPFLSGIELFMMKIGLDIPSQNILAIPIALSIFHSAFNVINALLQVGFAKYLVAASTRLVKSKDDEDEEFRLKFIDVGTVSTSELGIVQAKQEIALYAERTSRMFGMVKDLFNETNDKQFNKIYDRIEKYESISDSIEVEIAEYLTKLSEGELTALGSKRVQAMFKAISDIESIADSCFNLAKTLKRKKEAKAWFDQDMRDNLNKMMDLVANALEIMDKNLNLGYEKADIADAYKAESEINNYRDLLKREHVKNIETKKYHYMAGVIYSDMFSGCEKLADYVINVNEAIIEIKS
ncbi:MAG: Na/Pi cotransporter family protein [Bacteroidales bacterium]|jgi:phosphate:Na+ symporter|nr:Na/Pi cotransporter family protein [Bacteroidales bacterium]